MSCGATTAPHQNSMRTKSAPRPVNPANRQTWLSVAFHEVIVRLKVLSVDPLAAHCFVDLIRDPAGVGDSDPEHRNYGDGSPLVWLVFVAKTDGQNVAVGVQRCFGPIERFEHTVLSLDGEATFSEIKLVRKGGRALTGV